MYTTIIGSTSWNVRGKIPQQSNNLLYLCSFQKNDDSSPKNMFFFFDSSINPCCFSVDLFQIGIPSVLAKLLYIFNYLIAQVFGPMC